MERPHTTSSLEIQREVQQLKNGHTLSLDYHTAEFPMLLGPRSSLVGKLPSIPKLPTDLSVEIVRESIMRRSAHTKLLNEDPDCFRRKVLENSCADFVKQKNMMRALCDIHPISDPNDIAPPKFGYNFSKKKLSTAGLRTSPEDFIQPYDPTHERKTGYSRGHIRSVLQLDTYGPNHSERVHSARRKKMVPAESPNVDRNFSRPGTGHASPRSHYSDNFSATGKSEMSKSRSCNFIDSIKREDLSPEIVDVLENPHITSKYSVDPHANSLRWYTNYIAQIEATKQTKMKKEMRKKKKERQRMEALENQNLIQQFELRLSSTKRFM